MTAAAAGFQVFPSRLHSAFIVIPKVASGFLMRSPTEHSERFMPSPRAFGGVKTYFLEASLTTRASGAYAPPLSPRAGLCGSAPRFLPEVPGQTQI